MVSDVNGERQADSRLRLPPNVLASIEAADALSPIKRRVRAIFDQSHGISDDREAMEFRNRALLTAGAEILLDNSEDSDSNLPDEEVLEIFNGLSRRANTAHAVALFGHELAQAGVNVNRGVATLRYASDMIVEAQATVYEHESPEEYKALRRVGGQISGWLEELDR